MKEIDYQRIFNRYGSTSRENLIPILQDFQQLQGYISEDIVVKVASYLHLPTSKVFGLATFYDEFTFKAKGKYIFRICDGSACHISGSEPLLAFLETRLNTKAGETSPDGLFSLILVDCLGACALAPIVMVNEEYITQVEEYQLEEIIENCKSGSF